MTRSWWAISLFACLAGCALAQPTRVAPPPQNKQQSASPSKPQPVQSDEENPPEEDESVAPEKFVLNPLESDRNIKVGNYYWHRGKYRAAAERYVRATKYNPNSAEAFFKLGEAEQKLKDKDAARSAFQKVVTLAPDSKLASEAKKKINSKG